MAKTPITIHYNYTDSWTVMITITSKLCRLHYRLDPLVEVGTTITITVPEKQ